MQYLTQLAIIMASMTLGVFVGARLRLWQVEAVHRRLQDDKMRHAVEIAAVKSERYNAGIVHGRKLSMLALNQN